MTSPDTQERRLKESQLARARALVGIDTTDPNACVPAGAVMADPASLAHNNTYGRLPRFYVDVAIVCRNCGEEEVWPAPRQKWWYEVKKGDINIRAVLCRACRAAQKLRKAEARAASEAGLAKKKQRRGG
ncbi:zinc-ribbon domain containing protein [Marinobacterium sedimentorum]|uniref:zinc-ribbon domain containing protein n=1 Tax=Marinobacterium sedimentorum TaxID=2927804 RepID=UPI0020C657B1|nr:zinc-ribbon domain containing protein [Marinobacterium sedimentorum]MCP8688916.1 zinc-ribbon domain-containing protein [Marinobacterium sedimentorum]